MIKIDIKSDVENVKAKLKHFQREIPFAIASGLTSVGKIVKENERQTILHVFQGPVARTRSSVYLRWATKTNQSALVWIVEDAAKGTPPVKYLMPEIESGYRNKTRFERALERAGILGAREYVVPSKYAKLNASGNVTAGTYTRVLSQLRASPDPGQNRTGSARSKKSRSAAAYFYQRTGTARGIWERRGRAVKPLFVFVTDRPNYRRRFDFYGVANKTAARHLPREFEKAVIKAMATARVR